MLDSVVISHRARDRRLLSRRVGSRVHVSHICINSHIRIITQSGRMPILARRTTTHVCAVGSGSRQTVYVLELLAGVPVTTPSTTT